MVCYYCGFWANVHTIVTPLTKLLKDSVKYVWSSTCQQAFDQVKNLLSSAPVLPAPQLDLPFQPQKVASKVGVGAVATDKKGV